MTVQNPDLLELSCSLLTRGSSVRLCVGPPFLAPLTDGNNYIHIVLFPHISAAANSGSVTLPCMFFLVKRIRIDRCCGLVDSLLSYSIRTVEYRYPFHRIQELNKENHHENEYNR